MFPNNCNKTAYYLDMHVVFKWQGVCNPFLEEFNRFVMPEDY